MEGENHALEPAAADPTSDTAILARHRRQGRASWEAAVRERGFDSIQDHNTMVAECTPDTELKFTRLLRWRVNNGTKAELLEMIQEGKL